MITLPIGNRSRQPAHDTVSLRLFEPRPVSARHSRPAERAGLAKVRRVRGLLFDLDNVLCDATSWWRWLVQLVTRMGLATDYDTFYGTWRTKYLGEVHCGRREQAEALETFLLSEGLSRGQVDEIEAAGQARRRELDREMLPLPGVRKTLAMLEARGMSMGVLADADEPAIGLCQRLARMGIESRFCAVVSSFDLERTKPDAACYQAALALLGLPPEQVAYVGHRSDDVRGAAKAGMPTIAFNYDAGVRANVYLERFNDLLEVLEAAPLRAAAG